VTGQGINLGDYIDVAERVRLFRERYPEGSLQPVDPAQPFQVIEVAGHTFIVYVAAAYRHPDDPRPGIGTAWEPFPGRTPYTRDSEVMVAETSAWGRAIKACLLDDKAKIASLDEIRARKASETPRQTRQEALTAPNTGEPVTNPQKGLIRRLAHEKGLEVPDLDRLTKRDATRLIDDWKAMPDRDIDADPETPEEPF
jgi:hypothetical protein